MRRGGECGECQKKSRKNSCIHRAMIAGYHGLDKRREPDWRTPARPVPVGGTLPYLRLARSVRGIISLPRHETHFVT
jgi:hypothetical protein